MTLITILKEEIGDAPCNPHVMHSNTLPFQSNMQHGIEVSKLGLFYDFLL